MDSRFIETTIPSAWMILIFLGIKEIDFSDGIKWITRPVTTRACIGHDVDLLWKFDEEGAIISSLEWYFNNTRIGVSSDTDNFTVDPLYQDRIERLNRTEIRLKNVSLNDEGTYTFYPLPVWSTSQEMQNISLQVLVPPTQRCSCNSNCREHISKLTCELEMPDCGKPQVTAVGKQIKTFEVLGQGNFILINSSFHDKDILCCPTGAVMKCVADSHQFCESIQIFYVDDESPGKGGESNITDPANTGDINKSLNHCKNESSTSSNTHVLVLLSFASIVVLMTTIVAFYSINNRQRKMTKTLETQVRLLEETLNQNMKEKVEYSSLLSSSSGQHDDFETNDKPKTLYPSLREETTAV